MKSITLNPLSVLTGLVLAGVLFVVAGGAQSHGTLQRIPSRDVRVLGQIPAEDWIYVRLEIGKQPDGTISSQRTYSVPQDRYLVITDSQQDGGTGLVVNGALDDLAVKGLEGVRLGVGTHGTRFVFAPGTSLSAPTPGPGATYGWNLWGYLEPL